MMQSATFCITAAASIAAIAAKTRMDVTPSYCHARKFERLVDHRVWIPSIIASNDRFLVRANDRRMSSLGAW